MFRDLSALLIFFGEYLSEISGSKVVSCTFVYIVPDCSSSWYPECTNVRHDRSGDLIHVIWSPHSWLNSLWLSLQNMLYGDRPCESTSYHIQDISPKLRSNVIAGRRSVCQPIYGDRLCKSPAITSKTYSPKAINNAPADRMIVCLPICRDRSLCPRITITILRPCLTSPN